MSMELCGECLRLFDADTSIETPKSYLIPPLSNPYVNACTPIAADVIVIWRCPTCSLEDKVSA